MFTPIYGTHAVILRTEAKFFPGIAEIPGNHQTVMARRDSEPIRHFQTTHWSEVRRAGAADEAARTEALESLLRRYLPAVRSFLTSRLHGDEERAKDLAQGFVHDQFCLRNLCARADPDKGRFRTFLLTALDHYIADECDRERAWKRGGRHVHAALDEVDEAELGQAGGSHESFEVSWTRVLLDEALSRLRKECGASGRDDIWEVFSARVVSPALTDAEPVAYERLSAELRHASVDQTRELLTTGKRAYQRCLEAVIGEYEKGGRAVRMELDELKRALQRAAACRPPAAHRNNAAIP
jgi:RNA polymerase sigma-70 factor (ECF subfamily)